MEIDSTGELADSRVPELFVPQQPQQNQYDTNKKQPLTNQLCYPKIITMSTKLVLIQES
jgi:hypothetical protein